MLAKPEDPGEARRNSASPGVVVNVMMDVAANPLSLQSVLYIDKLHQRFTPYIENSVLDIGTSGPELISFPHESVSVGGGGVKKSAIWKAFQWSHLSAIGTMPIDFPSGFKTTM